MDPLTSTSITARGIDFNTERGKTLMYSNWECISGESTWDFNFDTCQWTTVSGSQSLDQVVLGL